MEHKDIPYIAFESEMARHERTVKRLLIALALAIVMLFVSNVAWLLFFNQFDISDSVVTVDSESEGHANYIGNDGDITNGEP